jgi:DNA-binding response OmpR family regulator
MRILIAEDDFTSRNILTAVLRKHGHEVIVTRSGLEAWEAMQQPDVILEIHIIRGCRKSLRMYSTEGRKKKENEQKIFAKAIRHRTNAKI